MSTAEQPILGFAGWRLDTRRRVLFSPDGRPVPLASRAFETLCVLASHPHELLEKQWLMDAVWPSAIVEENNLNQQISAVRKALGDGQGSQRFIVTETGRGFRFVQDVEHVAAARVAEPVGQVPLALRLPRRRWPLGIAVAALACAVLVASYAIVPSHPAAPTSVGDTHDADARAAYEQARALLHNVASTRAVEAVDLLEHAVKLDPNYAFAWAALAEAYTQAIDVPPASALKLSPVNIQQRISDAALRAIELAPDAPQTLQGAGMVSMQNRDWAEAERRLHRAVELAGPDDYDANFHFAWFLANVGRISAAVPFADRAMRAEPALMRPVAFRAALYEMQGRFDDAESLLLASSKLQGDEAMRRQGLIMVRLGTHDACGEPRERAADGLPCPLLSDPKSTLAQAREYYDEAKAHGISGQLFSLAHFTAFLGDDRLALNMLQLWAKEPTQNVHVIWRPSFADVRRMPEFEQLLRDVKLIDYWRASGDWGEFCREAGEHLTCTPFARVAAR